MNISDNLESSFNGENSTEKGTTNKDLEYLSIESRCIFFAVYLILLVVGIFGNVLSIKATIKRSHRFLQKTLTIALAISDIVILLVYAINNLETFSHPLVNWTIGSFMCKSIPVVQCAGVVANSAILVGIGLDRYVSVTRSMDRKWNPTPPTAITAVVLIFITSFGIVDFGAQ